MMTRKEDNKMDMYAGKSKRVLFFFTWVRQNPQHFLEGFGGLTKRDNKYILDRFESWGIEGFVGLFFLFLFYFYVGIAIC